MQKSITSVYLMKGIIYHNVVKIIIIITIIIILTMQQNLY